MLHDNIREIRRSRGMTQEALAEAMGVSAASVSKWETAQSSPDLAVLISLADFFEVSVDALLGHELKADKRQSMLEELNHFAEENRFEEAKALADKLLRSYPNVYAVVESAANLYFRIQVVTGDKSAMETSISLVKRLLTLTEGGEKQRLELLARLGNRYELLGDLEMARSYYEQANVSGSCTRALAYLREGNEEKRAAISENFVQELIYLVLDAIKLNELWQDAGEEEKAGQALFWAAMTLDGAGDTVLRQCSPAATALHLNLAMLEMKRGDPEAAREHVRRAAQLVKGKLDLDSPSFLTEGNPSVIASQELYDSNGLERILEGIGLGQFIPTVREV